MVPGKPMCVESFSQYPPLGEPGGEVAGPGQGQETPGWGGGGVRGVAAGLRTPEETPGLGLCFPGPPWPPQVGPKWRPPAPPPRGRRVGGGAGPRQAEAPPGRGGGWILNFAAALRTQ